MSKMNSLVEITKKFQHRFSIAVLIRIFFLFIILFGCIVLLYAYNQTEELKENVRTVNNLSIHSLEKSVQLRFAAFSLYDNSLNNRLEEAFIPFYSSYEENKGNIDKINLFDIRRKMNEKSDEIDLYIINESDVIISTTNNQDLFLNFKEKAPKFAEYLDQIRRTDGFYPDQVTGEIFGTELRKWAYMPTADHKYILEIGIKEKTFGIDRNVFMNLSEITSDITQSNIYIHDISMYNFKLVRVGSSLKSNPKNPDPIISQIFNTRNSSIEMNNGIPFRYFLYLKSDRAIYGYESSFVVEINTNISYIEKEILSIYFQMLTLFLIVLVISGLLLYFTLIRVSRPINDIISDIDQISQGNLDHNIKDPGIEEFDSLIKAIYRFKESILSEQLINQQLTARNTLLSQIIDSIPEPIFIIDMKHRIIGWNNAMEELTGHLRSEMIGSDREKYGRIFYSENEALIANFILDPELEFNNSFIKISHNIILTEGWLKISGQNNLRYLSAVAGPVYDSNGNIIAIIETIRDFSTLKLTEEALKKSEEKYRLIIENSHDIVFTLNKNRELAFLSPSWEKITGFTITETLGHTYKEYVHQDDIEELDKIINIVFKSGIRSDSVRFRFIHVKRNICWYSSVFNPVYDVNGSLMHISGVAHDITTTKQVEDSLKLALHKLNVLNSITRHDIKNQLTILMGFLHLDKENMTDSEQIRRNEVERKVGITIYNQIEFARLYHEIGLHEPIWQNVSKIFESVLTQLTLPSIIINNHVSNVEIFADPLFEKVLYTFIENSIRHGGTFTQIGMDTIETNKGLILVYYDDGCGIMNEEKELIFNHGYGQNTGLGLFLSREILSLTELTIQECGKFGEGVRLEIFVKNGLYRYNY